MTLLVVARMLVARVALAHWRASLGTPVSAEGLGKSARRKQNAPARFLARAVERAALRLPGTTLCLPQAMALQWMLRRRGLGSVILIGVRPGQDRGGLDDLHAWVVRDGEVLIGASAQPHHPLFAAQY